MSYGINNAQTMSSGRLTNSQMGLPSGMPRGIDPAGMSRGLDRLEHPPAMQRGVGPPELPYAGTALSSNQTIDLTPSSPPGGRKQKVLEQEIDYMKSSQHYVVTRFVFECGKKLEAQCLTIATAASLFHKFFQATKICDYDPYLIGATCLYLAGKVEDDHLKLRDVINVVHSTLHRSLEPLALGDQYWNTRDAIVHAELLVLRMVKFQVKFSHPHKYLLHYLKSLRDWISTEVWAKYPIARTSWSMLQDLYHDQRVLETDPTLTALATIQLALETYGIQVPFVGGGSEKGWFKVFNDSVTKEKLWDVMAWILEVYAKEAEVIQPLMIQS